MRVLLPSLAILAYLAIFAQGVVDFDKDGKAIKKELKKFDLETHTGEWIIRLNEESNFAAVEADVKSKKGKVKRELKSSSKKGKGKNKGGGQMDGKEFLLVEGLSKADLLDIQKRDQGVIDFEPNGEVHKTAYTWSNDRMDQTNLPLDNSFNPDYLGCGVDVYVADTGINTNHNEFTTVNARCSGCPREVRNTWNDFGSVTTNTDGDGHGTHCSGTVGGITVGVAPCTNIYGVKVLSDSGSGSYAGIIDGMDHVLSNHIAKGAGAKTIISMSLGGGKSTSLNAKVDELYEAGVIVVVAAGNDSGDAGNYSPASAPNAVTVGASDSSDRMASWSNTGSLVDIQGPGVNVNSARHDSNTGYASFSGTSMATPGVAGALAALLQKKPSTLEMTSADSVEKVVFNLVMQDSAKNMISGTGSTVNSLAMTPKNDGNWGQYTPPPPPVVTTVAYSASNTNSAQSNTFNHPFELCDGDSIEVSTCSQYSGDPFIRMSNQAGTQVASNDDGCGTVGGGGIFTVRGSGACQMHTIHFGCYSSGSCSGTGQMSFRSLVVPAPSPVPVPTAPVPVPTAPVPVPTAPVPVPTAPSICDDCASIGDRNPCRSCSQCRYRRGRCENRPNLQSLEEEDEEEEERRNLRGDWFN